jgi:DNA-binding transcriptional MerR regulator
MTQSRDPDARQRRVATQRPLQTINVFARAVGLSASALRQYGESGLLPPAQVEERTGYRYYSLDQQQRAIWIRRLRDAGLRLERIRAVFENDAAEAEAVLHEWRDDAREHSEVVTALVDDLTLALRARIVPNPARRTSVRFDATILASAVRQVASASADAEGDGDHDGVLIEVGTSSAAMVATDRYLLLARTTVPAVIDGPPARVRLSPAPVLEWLRVRRTVELIIDAPLGRDDRTAGVTGRLCDGHDGELSLPPRPDLFPSVHRMLETTALPPVTTCFPLDDVRRLTSAHHDGVVRLTVDDAVARITSGGQMVSGTGFGAPATVALALPALRRIADAAVGDELMCDVRGPDEALVWRSPDQPDFVAMVMPAA